MSTKSSSAISPEDIRRVLDRAFHSTEKVESAVEHYAKVASELARESSGTSEEAGGEAASD